MPTTRHLVLLGAGLVGAAAATTSAISLYGIAVKCGIPEPWAAANPIALDAGAAVAALAWITETGERRIWARRTAVTALAASLAENGVDHAIASGLMPVTLPLVLLVSACIPATLFAVVHLAALMARPGVVAVLSAPQALVGASDCSPVPAGLPPEPVMPRPRLVKDAVSAASAKPAEVRASVVDDEDDLEGKVRTLLDEGLGRPKIAEKLGLEPHEVRPIVEKIRPPVPRKARA